MKKWIAIVFLFGLAGCAKENRGDCFKSYGDEITESRALESFDSVFLEDRVDVEYHFSPEYRVDVIFGENIIEHIITKVENGNLKISNNTTCNWVRDLGNHPTVKIYAPTLAYMENRCSGDITFVDTLRSQSFLYEQWESNGVATFLLKNDVTTITMHVGFCDVNVNGQTSQSELYSAAVGRLRASGLLSPVALTNNSSFQDFEVYASEYLYAEINGSGSTRYFGSPDFIDQEINGSGSLIQGD